MPDALDLLATRRTVSAVNLGEPAPTDAQIRKLVEIAARVPDHGKLAPWRFILYRGDALQTIGRRLQAIYRARNPDGDPQRIEQELTRFGRSPVVIGVVSKAAPHVKIPEWEQVLSAGASAMNLLTAAHAMGFAAQWLTDWPVYDPEASSFLGLREGERFAGFVHLGTPKEKPAERPRPPVDEILTEWQG